MVGGYKVTTNISTKSALQIGVSPAPRRTPSETQRVTNLASSKIGAKRLEIHFCRETWVNSQQRAIFVYLLSKYDHKSCTPAGAKLTNEYTHRTNKNNPSTISVTPSQLCTFFRKRTGTGSNGGVRNFQRWKIKFPRLEILFSSLGKFCFLRMKLESHKMKRRKEAGGTTKREEVSVKTSPLETVDFCNILLSSNVGAKLTASSSLTSG